MHSGWGALVCISSDSVSPELVDRRRIVVIDPTMEGAKQPYHFAESLSVEQAEHHLHKCSESSQRLALKAVREMLEAVSARNYRVVDCAVLLASGRPLPALPNILASHALIHTAEGEFFRKVVREAYESCHIPVMGIRERELDKQTDAIFGKGAARVRQHISDLGKAVGSPWTQDEKTAALAAAVVSKTNGAGFIPLQ